MTELLTKYKSHLIAIAWLLTKYKSHLIAVAWVLVVLYFSIAAYNQGWKAVLTTVGLLAWRWVFGSAWTNAKKS